MTSSDQMRQVRQPCPPQDQSRSKLQGISNQRGAAPASTFSWLPTTTTASGTRGQDLRRLGPQQDWCWYVLGCNGGRPCAAELPGGALRRPYALCVDRILAPEFAAACFRQPTDERRSCARAQDQVRPTSWSWIGVGDGEWAEDARLAGGETGLAVVSCLSFAADADHLSPTGYLLVSLLLFIFGLVVVLLYFLSWVVSGLDWVTAVVVAR